jgi:hypothetical protein
MAFGRERYQIIAVSDAEQLEKQSYKDRNFFQFSNPSADFFK